MQLKKIGHTVFGVNLSATEKRAMDIEIKRQLAEYNQKNQNEIDAIILWELHKQFGFGEKRLKKFHDGFADAFHDLLDRYEMDNSDAAWLCTEKLKEIGVDITEWDKEGN